jgi:hypothetical protein
MQKGFADDAFLPTLMKLSADTGHNCQTLDCQTLDCQALDSWRCVENRLSRQFYRRRFACLPNTRWWPLSWFSARFEGLDSDHAPATAGVNFGDIDGVNWILAGKQPGLEPCPTPPGPQEFKQMWGQYDITVFAAFALFDPYHHAGGIDITDL